MLGMFERWIGPETFRKGVLDYLAEARVGQRRRPTTSGARCRRRRGRTSASRMATFLDQPGVPLVRAEPLDRGR